LFERNRPGLVSSTEYFSSGDWIQSGAQFGTFDSTSYSLSAFYRTARGQRPNNDVEQRQLVLQVKQQLSLKDSVYLEASHLEIAAGDLVPNYDNVTRFPDLRTKETQEPILTFGYHREWSPGQHTLLLASWLNDEFEYRNPTYPAVLAIRGLFESFSAVPMGTEFRNRLELFSVEPQHIWQQGRNVAIVGARYQLGDFRRRNLQQNPLGLELLFADPADAQDFKTDFKRWSLYAYDRFEVAPSLWLTAGLAYDRIAFPQNLFAPPFSERTTTEDQVSPKAGLVWAALTGTTVRFAYGRSLAGASLDQSVRLEPTQVAGFNQAFRSLIPESVEGSIPSARMETYGVSVEQKLGSGTYFGIAGEIADSDADRTLGAFVSTPPPLPPDPDLPPPPPEPAAPAGLAQVLSYGEKSLRVTVDQLLGNEWSLGARYQVRHADLRSIFPDISGFAETFDFVPQRDQRSLLHQVGLVASFNHRSGVFSSFEANWYSQSNAGEEPSRQGDDFWHFNLLAGYRFPHRRAELVVGMLNLTDRDYRLDPLTSNAEPRRGRTFTAKFRFNW
jgi:outer membrane receptor protein involved in Fe transport